MKLRHILWGKIWQQVCFSWKESILSMLPPGPGLIWFSGEDVVSAGRLCWWVDWCCCWGFAGWWSLFLCAWVIETSGVMQKACSCGGYNKSLGTWVSQSQFCEILPKRKDWAASESAATVMVKGRLLPKNTFKAEHLDSAFFKADFEWFLFILPGDSNWLGGDLRVPRGVLQTKQQRKW